MTGVANGGGVAWMRALYEAAIFVVHESRGLLPANCASDLTPAGGHRQHKSEFLTRERALSYAQSLCAGFVVLRRIGASAEEAWSVAMNDLFCVEELTDAYELPELDSHTRVAQELLAQPGTWLCIQRLAHVIAFTGGVTCQLADLLVEHFRHDLSRRELEDCLDVLVLSGQIAEPLRQTVSELVQATATNLPAPVSAVPDPTTPDARKGILMGSG